jgi:uncharacterized protein YgiM (DUF1202 family)
MENPNLCKIQISYDAEESVSLAFKKIKSESMSKTVNYGTLCLSLQKGINVIEDNVLNFAKNRKLCEENVFIRGVKNILDAKLSLNFYANTQYMDLNESFISKLQFYKFNLHDVESDKINDQVIIKNDSPINNIKELFKKEELNKIKNINNSEKVNAQKEKITFMINQWSNELDKFCIENGYHRSNLFFILN